MIAAAPRETEELRPITVLANQQPVTTGLEVCITPYGQRPIERDWTDAVLRDGKLHLRVAGCAPGDQGWAGVTRGDEVAVILLGPLPIF